MKRLCSGSAGGERRTQDWVGEVPKGVRGNTDPLRCILKSAESKGQF